MEKQTANRTDKIHKTDAEWRKQLSNEEYLVTRKKGTEPPFTGRYWNIHKQGVFRCVCCGEPLFDSNTKFDSGTAGQASMRRLTKPSSTSKQTSRTEWYARK
jgi:peptide-methionine (R)-S-oxide reductase